MNTEQLENTKNLIIDTTEAHNHTTLIEKDVEQIDHCLKTIIEDLEYSKKVNNSLHTLDSSLTTASDMLLLAQLIPQIKAPCSTLKKAVDELHVPVKKAVTASDKAEVKIKKIREKTAKLEEKVEKVDHVLLDTMNVEAASLSVLGTSVACITSLPDGDLKNSLSKQLDALSKVIDPLVLDFDTVQKEYLDKTERARKKASEIVAFLQQLVDLNNQIQNVMNVLSPLIKSLSAVTKALNQTITVTYGSYPTDICWSWHGPYPCKFKPLSFSFTIKKILKGGLGVISPVEKLLEKAMNAVLDPLLRALNLHITLPSIPGLSILSDMDAKLINPFEDLVKFIEDIYGKISTFEKFEADLNLKIKEIAAIDTKCQGSLKELMESR